MIETRQQEHAAQKWKRKYFHSLEHNEESEKRLKSHIELLLEGIINLSNAAKHIAPALDNELSTFSRFARQNAQDKRLPGLLTRLQQTIDQHISQQHKQDQQVMASLEQALAELLLLKLPGNQQRQIKRIQKRLLASKSCASEWSDHISSILQQQQQAQQYLLDCLQRQSSKPGLFAGLFQKNSSNNNPQDTHQHNTASTTAEPTAADAISTEATEIANGVSEAAANTASVLRQLLDKLALPENCDAKLQQLREQLDKDFQLEQLESYLFAIGEIINLGLAAQHSAFSDYLQLLNRQLQSIHDFLNLSRNTQNEKSQNAQVLDQSLNTALSEIQDSIDNSQQLDTLKQQLNSKLINISAALDQFKTAENAREAELIKRLDTLEEKLTQMEQESSQMQHKLETQKQLAQIDSLTELPNRASYNEQLNAAFQHCQQSGKTLVLIVADIDYFKKINDSYGHAAGDKVLKLVAKLLATNLRQSDFVARLGGEEFVILLSDSNPESSLKIAEKLRQAIANCPFHYKDQKVSVTTSFGLSTLEADDTPESLFERADAALYKAKHNGRNQCYYA